MNEYIIYLLHGKSERETYANQVKKQKCRKGRELKFTLSINVEKRCKSVSHFKIQELLTISSYLDNFQKRKLYLLHMYFKFLIKLLLISDSVTVLHGINTGKLLGEIQNNTHIHKCTLPHTNMCIYV